MIERGATRGQRVRDRGEIGVGIGGEVIGEVGGHRLERGARSGRENQHFPGQSVDPRGGSGASSRTAWALVPPIPKELTPARRGPSEGHGASARCTKNGVSAKEIRGLGRSKPRHGDERARAQAEDGLDQPREPGDDVGVAEGGLDRSDRARRAAIVAGEGARRAPPPRSDRRAASRSVRFEIANLARRDPRRGEGVADHRGLPFGARRGEAHPRRAVVVDRRAEDHRVDEVSIGDGLGEALEDDRGHGVAADGPRGAGVEGAAPSVGRGDPPLQREGAGDRRHGDRGGAGDRQIRPAREQALAGEVNGDERARARGLDDDAGAAEIRARG